MRIGSCPHLVGIPPCRPSRKIIAFGVGYRVMLSVVLVTLAELPSFCQSPASRIANPLPELAPGTIVRLVAAEKPAEPVSVEVSYSIVANGKSSGEAFELEVIDPTGKVKRIAMPEGIVLQPLRGPANKPPAVRTVGNVLSKQLTAYCLDFAKQPPEPGMLYRIAPESLQEKYKPIRSVLRAGRELAAAGMLHPDTDPAAYENDIRQYALWAKLENWGEQKFSEMFVEHTKKNAQAMNVKWTKQMEEAVLSLVPGRWRDISTVLQVGEQLSQESSRPGPQ